MNTKIDLSAIDGHFVYVKPVLVSDLPSEVREQAEGLETIFAVHNSDGEQLALVANQSLAYALARQHDMEPVKLH